MYHDRTSPAARVAAPRGPLRWLGGLLGAGRPDAEPGDPEMLPGGEASREEDLADLAALAEQLAALIGSAERRLDGAMALVDHSADEAAAYGRALTQEADAIDTTLLPSATVAALLDLTRTMIGRTQEAEARLRAATGELRTLQEDLSVARHSAERDPLTGLPNRRALEEALARAVATAHSTDAALALAFCDIDSFKRLNDVHGHAVGDRVLRLVADCLSQGAGEQVMVGRQGGEEFVMLFAGASPIEAAARVDAIRDALAARTLRSRSDGTPIGSVTFSAGVAGLSAGEAGEDLLRRADRALYRAKHEGRNQVVIDAGG